MNGDAYENMHDFFKYITTLRYMYRPATFDAMAKTDVEKQNQVTMIRNQTLKHMPKLPLSNGQNGGLHKSCGLSTMNIHLMSHSVGLLLILCTQ